jgi:hypothetical protein
LQKLSKTIPQSRVLELLAQRKFEGSFVFAFSDQPGYESGYKSYTQTLEKNSTTSLLSLSYFFSDFLKQSGISHQNILKENMDEEFADLFHYALDYAQNWFRNKDTNADFTEYKGLPLGYCLELLMFHFFQESLKCMTDVECFLKKEKPDVIFYYRLQNPRFYPKEGLFEIDFFESFFSFQCQTLGIEFYEVEHEVFLEEKKKPILTALKFKPLFFFKGITVKIPSFLLDGLKFIFLFIKNFTPRIRFKPGRPNILIASGESFNYLGNPLINHLFESKKFNLFAFNEESKQFKAFSILPKFSFASFFQKAKKLKLQSDFRNQFEKDKEQLRKSTEFRGIPFSDLFSSFFETLYLDYFPRLYYHAETVKTLLIKENINLVLSHSDHSIFERMSLIMANRFSIPTVSAQHGIEGQPDSTRLGYPSTAKYLFVWGKYDSDFKIAKNQKPESIKIVGCPLYPFQNYDQLDKPLQLDEPGTFLFIGNVGGSYRCDNRMSLMDNEKQIIIVLQAMKAFPKKTLIIKPRHGDPQISIYSRLVKELEIDNVQIETGPIVPFIKTCDLFINIYSTVGLEAILFNKPGIQFTFAYDGKRPVIEKTGTKYFPFAEYGANLRLDKCDAQELIALIKTVYGSLEVQEQLRQGRIRFLRDFAHYEKGNSVENFLNALEGVLCDQN